MKRIARVLFHDDAGCKQKSDGYKWALDERGNNWWSNGIQGEGKELYIEIAFRYGGGPANGKAMDGLQAFLEWELGPST